MKRMISAFLAVIFLIGALPLSAAAAEYTDVPQSSWAKPILDKAATLSLMGGVGGGKFGYGAPITRAEFVTVLCRMFGWDQAAAPASSFSDVAPGAWYSPFVETALTHNVFDKTETFRPNDPILRIDMAVMLVRALGYRQLAASAEGFTMPFSDVTEQRGYVAVAYDIGMVSGTGNGLFAPDASAKREEAAAMLVRVYERMTSGTEWLHGFYAFSSYDQRYVTREMDAVSAGWSRLSYTPERGVYMNTSATEGNHFAVPSSYESITTYLEQGGAPLKLNVYMDNVKSMAKTVLCDPALRTAAVDAIMAEVTRVYDRIGKSPYSGVTIDFEALRGEETRRGLNAFLAELGPRLREKQMTLYICVQPVTTTGYYDGFDYKTIGELCDKVILMAHDYNATSLAGFVGSEYYKTTAVTPFNAIYYALRALTDPQTGVADRSKLALAISFGSVGWKTKDGKLTDPSPVNPAPSTIYTRLVQPGSVIGWSEQYRNPYVSYTTEEGQDIFLWYEDARSVGEKVRLARLMGISGVSVWRIGNIPDFKDDRIFYDAWSALK